MINIDKNTGLWFKYFILQPGKIGIYGDASRKALKIYAEIIHPVNPELADDIEKWLKTIKEKLVKIQ